MWQESPQSASVATSPLGRSNLTLTSRFRIITPVPLSLIPGSRVGPYEIGAQIGVGGMGEVYRATDTNLARQVAIKVLPEAMAADVERLARFDREAKTLAALNHPNIAAIYGLEKGAGTSALVMELVEGPTLADRIAQSAIPVDEALPIARQIAEALEAAHEQGIIHRDLKPANIKLRPDGAVKVLDFGLAKALEPVSGTHIDATASPTITSPAMMTGVGVLMGTAAYMSPEQARGKGVDKRADIWAFGCVLYEMLTGRRAFEGEDVPMTLSQILQGDPALDALPGDVPARVRQTVDRCLRKRLKERMPDIGAVRLMLEGAFETTAATAATQPPTSRRRSWGPAAALAVVAAIALVAGTALVRDSVRRLPERVTRFVVTLPPGQRLVPATTAQLALSPNGESLVYSALQSGRTQLFVRRLDQLAARPIDGTVGGQRPFFSPDGQWIAFSSIADGQLKKVPAGGGATFAIAPIGAAVSPASAWGPDDQIIFGRVGSSGLFRVPASGGTPSVLTTLTGADEDHDWPQVLPGGKWFLSGALARGASWPDGSVIAQSFETGERRKILDGGTYAKYARTGHIVFWHAGNLLAVPFDLKTLLVTGPPVIVVEEVAGANTGGEAAFALADNGTLAYVPGGNFTGRELVWVDRTGREEAIPAPPNVYFAARLSPEGNRVVVSMRGDEPGLWVWDLTRGTLMRLGSEPISVPHWTADGKRIFFAGAGEEAAQIWGRAADGTGSVEAVTHESRRGLGIYGITPDGRTLVVRERNDKTGDDLLAASIAKGEEKFVPLLQTPSMEMNAALSPDGKWLVYQSNESGRNEVFVRPFPNVEDGKWQISTQGGTFPTWARSGRELFYVSTNGDFMAVPVQLVPAFAPGTPVRLFEWRYFTPLNFRSYDVGLDDKRFLMIREAATSPEPQSIVVVENWLEELKERLPTK